MSATSEGCEFAKENPGTTSRQPLVFWKCDSPINEISHDSLIAQLVRLLSENGSRDNISWQTLQSTSSFPISEVYSHPLQLLPQTLQLTKAQL